MVFTVSELHMTKTCKFWTSSCVQGEDFDLGASRDDYRVAVEVEDCRDVDVISNRVSCLPPAEKPEVNGHSASGRDTFRITVSVILICFYCMYTQSKLE